MKVKFGSIIIDGAGKLGGNILAQNKAGKHIKNNKKYSQRSSDDQKRAQAIYAGNSFAWRQLSEAFQDAWRNAAADWKLTNRFGDIMKLSGQQLFIKANNNILKVGGARITVPPTKVAVSAITQLQLIICDGVVFVHYEASNALPNEVLLIEFTDPMYKSVKYIKDRFRKLQTTTNLGSGELDLNVEYYAKFGVPANGKKINARAQIVNSITGQIGVSLQASTIVGEIDILPILEHNTVGWYDSTDLTTLSLTVGDAVTEWRDKLISGRDLKQTILIKKPIWTAAGILFDGINDVLKADAFTYEQPETIYIVFQQLSWTFLERVFDGNSTDTGHLTQRNSSPGLRAGAGSSLVPNSNLALGVFGIATIVLNGINSSLQINRTAKTVGDAGLSDMGGFTLAAYGSAAGGFCNIEVKEIILRDIVDTALDENIIYIYLAQKYGI